MNNILEKEAQFHDEWAQSENAETIDVVAHFEACTAAENRWFLKQLEKQDYQTVLDLGCGLGEAAVYFAKMGKDVIATDLSQGMLDNAQKCAKKHHVKIKTIQSSSDRIHCQDNSIDVVYAANVLHHVDIEKTMSEIFRVLKPGGLFLSWDPLKYNPVINIYRRMANEVRTEDEAPLGRKEIKQIRGYFSESKIKTTWLATLFIFVMFFVLDNIHPNQERYWKKIIKDHQKLEGLYRPLLKLDGVLLACFPFLKYWCWNICIFAKK